MRMNAKLRRFHEIRREHIAPRYGILKCDNLPERTRRALIRSFFAKTIHSQWKHYNNSTFGWYVQMCAAPG